MITKDDFNRIIERWEGASEMGNDFLYELLKEYLDQKTQDLTLVFGRILESIQEFLPGVYAKDDLKRIEAVKKGLATIYQHPDKAFSEATKTADMEKRLSKAEKALRAHITMEEKFNEGD